MSFIFISFSFLIRALLIFLLSICFIKIVIIIGQVLTCKILQLWVGPGSKAAEEKQFFDRHLAPFYRIEQVLDLFKCSFSNCVIFLICHLWLINIFCNLKEGILSDPNDLHCG